MPDVTYTPASVDMSDEKAVVTVTATAPAHSFASMSKEEIAIETEEGKRKQKSEGNFDPLGGKVYANEDALKMRMSGVASADFVIGDKIYHKGQKMEAEVIDVSASGKVQVKYTNNSRQWVLPKNIVKL